METDYLSIGSIIIDDIQLPNGMEKLDILGGGLTHGVMGMRVWSDRVGMISSVGADFEDRHLALLQSYFDVSGLKVNVNKPTPRAWQVFDADGTRHETFQTDFNDMQAGIPKPDQVIGLYPSLKGAHLQCPPQDVGLWAEALRERACQVILWEPWDGFCVPEHVDKFLWNSQQVDIVSPNLREGRMLTGLVEPEEIARKLQANGAKMVVIRMAEAGSLVLDPAGQVFYIPAFPVNEIEDITGAGNAYCGGFVVGFALTGDAQIAGWYGGVSASLTLHQFGALFPLEGLRQKALNRLDWYRYQVKSG